MEAPSSREGLWESSAGGRAGHSLGPDNGVVELRVDGLQVLQRRALVQHPFVEGQREAGVDELPMVQSLWQGGDTGSLGTLGQDNAPPWGSHGAEGIHSGDPELWHLLLAGTHGEEGWAAPTALPGPGGLQPLSLLTTNSTASPSPLTALLRALV